MLEGEYGSIRGFVEERDLCESDHIQLLEVKVSHMERCINRLIQKGHQ